MLIPAAQGLFREAIMESAAPKEVNDKARGNDVSQAYLKIAGASSPLELQKLSMVQMREAQKKLAFRYALWALGVSARRRRRLTQGTPDAGDRGRPHDFSPRTHRDKPGLAAYLVCALRHACRTEASRVSRQSKRCAPACGASGCEQTFARHPGFLALPDGMLGIALGDVSGKGIAAALMMASLQASLRAEAPRA